MACFHVEHVRVRWGAEEDPSAVRFRTLLLVLLGHAAGDGKDGRAGYRVPLLVCWWDGQECGFAVVLMTEALTFS